MDLPGRRTRRHRPGTEHPAGPRRHGAGNAATFVYLVLCVLWGLAGGPMPADTPSYLWPMDAR